MRTGIPSPRRNDPCAERWAALDLDCFPAMLPSSTLSPRRGATRRPSRSREAARSPARTPPSYTESSRFRAMLEPALPRRRYWHRAPDSATAVARSWQPVAHPCSPGQGGERREKEDLEEADLEQADLEGLGSEKVAEEATTVAASQTQADCSECSRLRCHTAAPSLPFSLCTEVSLRADSVFACECWLAFSYECMRNCQFCMFTIQITL